MAMQLTKLKSSNLTHVYKLVKYLKNLIHKGYDITTIVYPLRQVYFDTNIDNLLVQLVGQTNN
jgi:hypothetical protein